MNAGASSWRRICPFPPVFHRVRWETLPGQGWILGYRISPVGVVRHPFLLRVSSIYMQMKLDCSSQFRIKALLAEFTSLHYAERKWIILESSRFPSKAQAARFQSMILIISWFWSDNSSFPHNIAASFFFQSGQTPGYCDNSLIRVIRVKKIIPVCFSLTNRYFLATISS